MTTDARTAALLKALIKGSYLNGSWFDHEQECAAAILGERGVFLPDGLPKYRIWCSCGRSVLSENWPNHLLRKGDEHHAVSPLIENEEQAATIATLRAALQDLAAILPADRWHLVRPTTTAALAAKEAGT